MSRPQNPDDPDSLSLAPSSSLPQQGADFSGVQGHAGTVPDRGGGGGGAADFSGVRGAATTVPNRAGGGGAGNQSYTVKKGDTLSAIAQHHYGKASQWKAIFEANRDLLDDPDLIKPGQVLRLP